MKLQISLGKIKKNRKLLIENLKFGIIKNKDEVSLSISVGKLNMKLILRYRRITKKMVHSYGTASMNGLCNLVSFDL